MNDALATPPLSMPRYAGLPLRVWKVLGLTALLLPVLLSLAALLAYAR